MPGQPWEQLPNESQEHYALFSSYLQACRPRNITAFAQETDLPMLTIRKIANKHVWNLRCEAYDAYLVREVTARIIEQRTATTMHHMELLQRARGVSEATLEALEKEIDQMRIAGELMPLMAAKDLASYIDKVVSLERRMYGEIRLAETLKESGSEEIDMSVLTDEELDTLCELWRKCTGKNLL